MIANKKQLKSLFLSSFLFLLLASNICYGGKNKSVVSDGAGDGLTCIHYKINNYTDNVYMFVAHGVTNLAMKTGTQTVIKRGNKTKKSGKPNVITTGVYYFSSGKRHKKDNELEIRIIPMLENKSPILNPDKSVYYYCGKEIYKKLPVIKINPEKNSQCLKELIFNGKKIFFYCLYNSTSNRLKITIFHKRSKFKL